MLMASRKWQSVIYLGGGEQAQMMGGSNLSITAIFYFQNKALVKPFIPYIIHTFTSEIEDYIQQMNLFSP